MQTYQQCFTQRIEKRAAEKNLDIIEQKNFDNRGLWLFNRNGKIVGKASFDFQTNYTTIHRCDAKSRALIRFRHGDNIREDMAVEICVENL